MSNQSGVEADPNAGLSQSMAMNPLVNFTQMEESRSSSRLDEISSRLRRDARAVEAAEQAIEAGELSPEEAHHALLYECHILCADDIECHHPPEKVRAGECEKCGASVPEIPGFEAGRRKTTDGGQT